MVHPYIPLEQWTLSADGSPPDWTEGYGDEVYRDRAMLNRVYFETRDKPFEYRDKLLEIVQQKIIPMRNRFRDLEKSEMKEGFALSRKYEDMEDGLLAGVFKEYNAFIKDLETRLPILASYLKYAEEKEMGGELMSAGHSKVFCEEGKPTIQFGQHGCPPWYDAVLIKGLEAVRDHLVKKVNLLESQNNALTRAYEEHGLQLPHGCTNIQRQIDAFKRSTSDELAQAEEAGQKTGEQKERYPSARLVSFHEDPDESAFTAVYEDLQKDYVPPPPPKPLPQMSWDERMDLLKTMCIDRCGKFFDRPLTEENSPNYFDVVKDHRDLTTIKADMRNLRAKYDAENFMHDIRLMLDNYTHVFGEGSKEHKMAERFEKVMFVCLEDYGEYGETAKVCELSAAERRS